MNGMIWEKHLSSTACMHLDMGFSEKVIQQKDGEKDFALSAAYTWLVQHYGQVKCRETWTVLEENITKNEYSSS